MTRSTKEHAKLNMFSIFGKQIRSLSSKQPNAGFHSIGATIRTQQESWCLPYAVSLSIVMGTSYYLIATTQQGKLGKTRKLMYYLNLPLFTFTFICPN